MTLQLHSWAFIPQKWTLRFTQNHVGMWSQQLYLQRPKPGIGPWAMTTMKYHSAQKRNTPLAHTATWVDLQAVLLDGKKASPKRLHRVWFQYMTCWKGQHFRNRGSVNGCQEFRIRWGEAGHRAQGSLRSGELCTITAVADTWTYTGDDTVQNTTHTQKCKQNWGNLSKISELYQH